MDKPMTKTEIRAYMKRQREAIRMFEEALKANDWESMYEAAGESNGAAAAMFEFLSSNGYEV